MVAATTTTADTQSSSTVPATDMTATPVAEVATGTPDLDSRDMLSPKLTWTMPWLAAVDVLALVMTLAVTLSCSYMDIIIDTTHIRTADFQSNPHFLSNPRYSIDTSNTNLELYQTNMRTPHVGFWFAGTGRYFNVYNDYNCFALNDSGWSAHEYAVYFDGDTAFIVARCMTILALILGVCCMVLQWVEACYGSSGVCGGFNCSKRCGDHRFRYTPRSLFWSGVAHVLVGVMVFLFLIALESETLCQTINDPWLGSVHCELNNAGKLGIGAASLWMFVGMGILLVSEDRRRAAKQCVEEVAE